MSAWQPIATAPRKGAALLLLGETIPELPYIRVGSAISAIDALQIGEVLDADWGWLIWNSGNDWYVVEADEPTHWMPLPSPPEQATGAA